MRARLSRDRVGDETLPLVRSRGMRACLSWDRVEMNPASREIEPRPIVFPAPFRQGSSVQLRVLHRPIVLKVVDSAVLHPGLLHMRPLQLWLESRVPWTAWTSGCLRITATSKLWRNPDAPDDHDGCIDSRLGSSVRGNASFGTVAGISEPVALKSPGAGSSLLSSKGFSATAGPAKCTDSHQQHVCGFVHKSLRRVEIAPRVGSDDLEPLALRESGGGSVRQSENTHCLLFFTPHWHHADQQLARMHFLRSRNVTAGVMSDQGGASIRDTHRPESSLGSQTWRNCWRHRLAVPRQEIYAIPGRTWNYRAIMCDRFRGIREGRLTVSHAHGSAKTLYKTFVCFKWECLWRSQAHIDLTTCTLCSEFPAAQTG